MILHFISDLLYLSPSIYFNLIIFKHDLTSLWADALHLPPSSPCTSHLFVLPWILYLLKRTRQIDQYSNSIFQTYFCPNSIFRPRAVHIFSLEQGNRRILTLIEFYWISSFLAWALGAPLKQSQFLCIFTTHPPWARDFYSVLDFIFIMYHASCMHHESNTILATRVSESQDMKISVKMISVTKCRIQIFAVENRLNCLDPLLKSPWQPRQAEK